MCKNVEDTIILQKLKIKLNIIILITKFKLYIKLTKISFLKLYKLKDYKK